jgi:hypothetical protein
VLISTVHKSPQHPLSLFAACCVSSSRFLAMVSNSEDTSASHAHVLLSQPPMQNSCQMKTQLTGSQAGGHSTPTSLVFSLQLTCNWQLTAELSHSPTSYFTSLYSTELLKTSDWTNSLLQTVLLITSRHGPHRKCHFHCYSPTIPRPLHRNGCLFIRLLYSNGCFTVSPLSNESILHNTFVGTPFIPLYAGLFSVEQASF